MSRIKKGTTSSPPFSNYYCDYCKRLFKIGEPYVERATGKSEGNHYHMKCSQKEINGEERKESCVVLGYCD